MDDKQQELIFRLSMFEQQIRQLQQQIQAVDNGIIELNNLSIGLGEITGGKDREIFAPIGRGIFVKAKILSEDLTVDVGSKNFVKKSVPETQKMIEEQMSRLGEARQELESNLDGMNEEIEKVLIQAQEREEKK
ncbi:MAG: prefoldin subunit alpha [Nanoarchaeota archaeon]|mgnify:FL=1